MQSNSRLDELSIDLITHDFNSQSFLMFLRRQNERHREVYTSEHDRQYRSKYCVFDHSRGFDRLINIQTCNPGISSHMISNDGIIMTDDLSQQLLDANLSLVRRHWRRSKMTYANKMEDIQSNLNLRTNTSLKKAMNECQKVLFNWIPKNTLR